MFRGLARPRSVEQARAADVVLDREQEVGVARDLRDRALGAVVQVGVVLLEGGSVSASGNGAGSLAAINSCSNPTGALPPIVAAM